MNKFFKKLSIGLVALLVLGLALPNLQVDARDGYDEFDWQPDGFGTWEPKFDDQDYNNPHIVRDADNSPDFIPSGRFTQEDLPVGSILEVVGEEFSIVVMHWIEDGKDAHTGDAHQWIDGGNELELTEEWWAGKSHVAFNAAKRGHNLEEENLTDEVIANVNVWVPEGAAGEDPAPDNGDDTNGEDPTSDNGDDTNGEDPTPDNGDDTNNKENPQTLDMTNNSLYLVLAGGSVLTLLGVVVLKRKSSKA